MHHHGIHLSKTGFQPGLSMVQQGPNLLARGQNLAQEGVHLRFSGICRAEAAYLIDVGDDILLEGAEDAAALGKGGLLPT
mmetsp:Transcript_24029/g.50687  ORF Transcript_24029/g.50687 Transcript_24029/m.50687 type:complete len:80 (-) Transcript_24029:585-824(-)